MIGLRSVEESYGTEIIRKGIHLTSLLIPIVYSFVSKRTALAILIPLTLAFSLSDIARLWIPAVGRWYSRFFGFLLRAHEKTDEGRHLNGATYVLLSATLLILFFPKVIVISAFAILIVSDTSAALIGRRFGKHRFMTKSVEGSLAFFVSALVVVAVSPKLAYLPAEYALGAAAGLVGALVEASAIGLDDNLSIPLSVGGIMWIMYALFLPSLDLFPIDAVR